MDNTSNNNNNTNKLNLYGANQLRLIKMILTSISIILKLRLSKVAEACMHFNGL